MHDRLAASDIIDSPLHYLIGLIVERLKAEVKRLLLAVFAFIIFEGCIINFAGLLIRGVLLLIGPFLLF